VCNRVSERERKCVCLCVKDNDYEVLQLPGHSNYRIKKNILFLLSFSIFVILITCNEFVTLISDQQKSDVITLIFCCFNVNGKQIVCFKI
jgi:hypothetical protein